MRLLLWCDSCPASFIIETIFVPATSCSGLSVCSLFGGKRKISLFSAIPRIVLNFSWPEIWYSSSKNIQFSWLLFCFWSGHSICKIANVVLWNTQYTKRKQPFTIQQYDTIWFEKIQFDTIRYYLIRFDSEQ